MADPTHGHTQALAARLSGLPDDARPAALLDLVRAETAALMGAAPRDIDPAADYRAYGYTSLAAVELSARLSTATGLDLPLTLLFDHPTPAAVAAHLLESLGFAAPAPAAAPAPLYTPADAPASGAAAPAHGPLTTLLLTAHARGELGAAVPRLQAAGADRPFFSAAAAPGTPPRAVLVSEGAAAPAVVCVPSFLAGSGPHQFTRFAARFAPRLRMSGLTLPGFDATTPLPATWRAAVDSLTAAAVRAAGDAPLLLVGHSIGGALAHAVAATAERAGHEVAGAVLIDTYEPEVAQQHEVFGWAMGRVLDLDRELLGITEHTVRAMGGYLRLFDDWTADPLLAPALLVAAESGPEVPGGDRWALWRAPATVVPVPGDHFSLLEEHAAATARTVEDWLRKETPCSPSA